MALVASNQAFNYFPAEHGCDGDLVHAVYLA